MFSRELVCTIQIYFPVTFREFIPIRHMSSTLLELIYKTSLSFCFTLRNFRFQKRSPRSLKFICRVYVCMTQVRLFCVTLFCALFYCRAHAVLTKHHKYCHLYSQVKLPLLHQIKTISRLLYACTCFLQLATLIEVELQLQI